MNDEGRRVIVATLYPLVGLERSWYSFRVLRVREPIPHDNLRPIRLQRWADKIWRRELRCPVYCTMQLGYPAFLIPKDASPPVGSEIEIVDVPDKVYHIEATDKCLEVSIEDAVGAARELVCRMIERAFADRLVALRDTFWRGQWTLFFRMRPENEGISTDVVNAYRGFKFGVVFLQNTTPHLAVDVRTRYVGKKSLLEYSEAEKGSILERHLNLDIRVEERAYFLRDNGNVKVPCRYTGGTGRRVNECTFDGSGETVYEYYSRRYPTLQVVPHEIAVFVQDRDNEHSVPVPISRLFPLFTTEYEGLRTCSVRSQIPPGERAKEIAWFLV